MMPLRDSAETTLAWGRDNRMAVVGLALALVAVPTFAVLFPGFIDRTARPYRVAVMVGWLGVAAIVTAASRQRATADRSIARPDRRIVLRQYLALVLGPHNGAPAHYRFCVYRIDETGDFLLPSYPSPSADPDDPTVLRVGQGTTGYAVESQEMVFAIGDGISIPEFGLSPAQQELFSNDAIVGAVPIRLVTDELVGALSVASHTNDGYFVSETHDVRPDGAALLRRLADEIGDLLSIDGMELDE
jgi:hypothetical protein